jgi:ribonuclease HI
VNKKREEVIVYTDGACSGNPGPGGWGSIVLMPDDQIVELGEGQQLTTNNQMEMMAALKALEYIRDPKAQIVIYTDSTYLIRGMTQWVWAWQRRGWKTASGESVQNQELWQNLISVKNFFSLPLNWKYVRGHTGHPGNERCDKIAVAFSKNDEVNLFSGSLKNYSYDIAKLPEDQVLPEMKPKGEKKVAYSYLSLVDGQLLRHKSWSSCEAKVKGRSGAKFKKSNNADEEKNIAEGWGLAVTDIKNGD